MLKSKGPINFMYDGEVPSADVEDSGGYEDVLEIIVSGPDGETWVWGGRSKTHHPADRVGGPFGIWGFAEDSWGDKAYLFFDTSFGHFPQAILVLGQNESDAYEWLIDAMEKDLAIPEEDMKDYLNAAGEYGGEYSSGGVPVDTSWLAGGNQVTVVDIG